MYKLMLVDDEDEVREGIEATVDFESCGFTLCAQATGAIDAIEKAGQFQPDVVFTDVHMPYMDGMEMISRLQEMYPTMKYIVLSGYDDFIYVKQALQRQVLDYLLKPLSAQGIMKVLRRVKEQLDEQARQRVDLEHLREKAAQDAQLARRAAILEYIMGASGGDITQAFSAFRAELVFQPAELSAGMDQLCTLTLFVADSVRQEVATSGSEMIARAVQYVRQNYPDKELSLESLCQTFGVSQTQFSLLFKRETGTSFLQYLLDLRIEKAQSLLAESNQKIYQIAEETGFGDASYFSYCFKQRCGLSPKEFRMQRGTTG